MSNIVLENLNVSYYSKKDEIEVIKNMNAEFSSKSLNVVMGPSGCGKTTLIRAILGLIDYGGTIFNDEINLSCVPTNKRNFSYVSQDFVLYPRMTIFDNIAFPLKNSNCSNDEIVKKVYDIAKLLDLTFCLTRKPRQLSGGQQQRVALARALVGHSNVCLFDEPFSNLDEKNRQRIRMAIKKILDEKKAITIFVTHDLEEALSIGDKIFVMDEGKFIFSGSAKELMASNNECIKSMVKNSLTYRPRK